MTQLTDKLKSVILETALSQSKVGKEKIAFNKRMQVFAGVALTDHFGGEAELKKLKAAIKRIETSLSKLPRSIATRNPIVTNYSYANLRDGISHLQVRYDEKSSSILSPREIKIDPKTSIGRQFAKLAVERLDIDERVGMLRTSILRQFEGHKTVSSLLKAWPECIQLMPEIKKSLEKEPKCNNDINKALGLKLVKS